MMKPTLLSNVLAFTVLLGRSFLAAADVETLEKTDLRTSSAPLTVRLRFTAPGKDWTGTLLSRRAPPGQPSLCVTGFKHEPFGKRFLGFAMDGTVDGPVQAAAKTVRDDVIGGHLVCAFLEMDQSLDEGTHDLVFRSDGKTAELFLDGVRHENRSTKLFTARTYLKLYPHSKPAWKLGSDPDGGDVFPGEIEKVEIIPKFMPDGELGISGSEPASTENPRILAAGLFPPTMTDAQRMSAIDAAMPQWLAATARRDPWFPRYHLAIPSGMMFDTRCAIHRGRYHLFPTWRASLNLTSAAPSSFRMMHLSSADLIRWRFDPFPLRLENSDVCNGGPTMIDGTPNFFFLRYGANGAPYRGVSNDPGLIGWSLVQSQPNITLDGEGYQGRLDSVVFTHDGKTYLTGTRRNAKKTSMAMPLYRSDDLVGWKYIGDFYQTDTLPFNECPQIFHVGGKMVVTAFYPLRGRRENYLVGRFENERFVPEAGGVWDHGGHGHVRSFDADTAPDDGVIGWSTLSVYSEHDALETARLGWKGMHSLPKEVTLRSDGTLALNPARQLVDLRANETNRTLPLNHHGCFEVELVFTQGGKAVLTDPSGSLALQFDDKSRILTLDTGSSPKQGSDTGHLFRTPPLGGDKETEVRVRLFFDRSVIELFVDGHVISARHYPHDPAKISLQSAGNMRVKAWLMKSIWNP